MVVVFGMSMKFGHRVAMSRWSKNGHVKTGHRGDSLPHHGQRMAILFAWRLRESGHRGVHT